MTQELETIQKIDSLGAESSTGNSASQKKPKMFLYSLILPTIWFSLGIAINSIAPGKHLGMFGLFIVIHLTLLPICWHFAKMHRRQFTTLEKFKLTAYFCLWAYAAELLALFYLISSAAPENAISPQQVIPIVAFTLVVDTVFFTLGVIFTASRMLKYFINRQSSVVA